MDFHLFFVKRTPKKYMTIDINIGNPTIIYKILSINKSLMLT